MRERMERTVHIDRLVDRLRKNGADVVVSYEPFGWQIAATYTDPSHLLQRSYWGTDGSGEPVRVTARTV